MATSLPRTYFYIPKESEEHCRNYNYKSIDESIIAPKLTPIWHAMAQYIPLNINPNVITVAGLAHTFLAYGLVYYYCSSPAGVPCNIPGWVFAAAAYLLLAYEFFDALDGQQGKRVGMYTNATTELFDHGCDSITTVLSAIIFMHALNLLVSPTLTIMFLMSVFTVFFMSTWELTSTGLMIFRLSGNPTEGLVGSVLCLLFTGIVGNQFWLTRLCDFLPFTSCDSTLGALRLNDIMVTIMFVSALRVASSNVKAIYNAAVEQRSDDQTEHGQPCKDVVKNRVFEFLPFALMGLMGWFWTHRSLFQAFPRTTVLCIGLQFNQMIMRLIIAEVTKRPYNWQASLYAQMPLALPILFGFENFASLLFEEIFVGLFLGYSFAMYAEMTYNFCSELCAVLNMPHWWSIPAKEDKKLNPKGSE